MAEVKTEVQTFEDFLAKQEEIYGKFDPSQVQKEGIKKGFHEQGGYLIIFRHPDEVAQHVEEFTANLARVVPAIAYTRSNLHTTVSDYDLQPLSEFSPKRETLDTLASSVRNVQRDKPGITYSEWLYNQGAVIVAGSPTEPFFSTAKRIIEEGRKLGLEKLRLPWGAHMTAVRFTDTRTPDQLQEFYELMRNAPILGESTPQCIDVGYFTLSSEFNLYIHERFPIQ